MERAGSSFWDNIEYIQGQVSWSHKLCDMRIIIFIAPINKENPEKEIIYDLNKFEDDNFLRISNISLFCLKQCYKIAHFLAIYRNIVFSIGINRNVGHFHN